MTQPRPYTEEECREMLLDHFWGLARYWSKVENQTDIAKLEGLLHSVLTTLDGCSGDMPAFKVIPCPHEDDEADRKAEGENWWPNDIDLAGGLHERLYDGHRRSSQLEDQVEYLKMRNNMLRRKLEEAGVDLPDFMKSDELP